MALHHRHRARAPALVGDREFRRGAEREGRDHLDRERRGMIVVDDDADVRLGLGHPLLGALEARNTRCQYGSPVAMIVDRGADRRHVRRRHSCDDPSHGVSFLCCGFRLRLRLVRLDDARSGLRVLAGPAAVAFDRAAAAQHQVGIVLLGRAGHHRREMLERMAVGRAELGGEIDVAAEFQHPVVLALEDRLALIGRERKLVEILRLVALKALRFSAFISDMQNMLRLIALRASGRRRTRRCPGCRRSPSGFFVLRAPLVLLRLRLSPKRLIYR